MNDSKKFNRESKAKRNRSIRPLKIIKFNLIMSLNNLSMRSSNRNLINMTKLPKVFSNSSVKMN